MSASSADVTMRRFGTAAALGMLRQARRGTPKAPTLPLVLALGAALSLGSGDACAAALGGLATSVGLFAALAALFVIKSWPAHLTASGLSTASGALVIAGGATWLWRAQVLARLSSFAGWPRTAHVPAGDHVAARPTDAMVTLPDEIDRADLIMALRRQFVAVQQAWDRRDMTALRLLATTEMVDELCLELAGCAALGEYGRTEVLTVHAELLGFESLPHVLVLSVEFSGLIREAPEAGAVPFRELWMLTQSKLQASGWRLARHQALL